MVHGAQCVMTHGISMMLMWYADRLDLIMPPRLSVTLGLAKVTEQSGWTMWHVMAVRLILEDVCITDGTPVTAAMLKMLEFGVMVWYMYVSMYKCVCVCVHYTYTHVHAQAHAHTHTHTCYVHTHIHIYTHIHTYNFYAC